MVSKARKPSIKPFKATHFNPSKVKSYSKVVCPPYDVISKAHLACLRERSQFNFSHLLITDKGGYAAVGRKLNEWLKSKVLIDDDKDCFYLYEQAFKVGKKTFKRYGVLSLLRMEKKDIFPHEYTLSAPKVDRKKMIRAVKANLSPIFCIAVKPVRTLKNIYLSFSAKKPFASFKDEEGIHNRVWKIFDKRDIEKISQAFNKAKLVIADGHHRFEISYDYFLKNKDKFQDLDYVLAFVTDVQEGLLILPTHRVISLDESKDSFIRKAGKYFKLKKVTKGGLENKLSKAKRFAFGLCWGKEFFLLELKDAAILGKIKDKSYRNLDTYVFHQLVLPLFKTSGGIKYTHSLNEAASMVKGTAAAFILRPATLKAVFSISSKGCRLPQKSTYFYPKLTSGIVVRRFLKHG
ncbi:MAG: DUF1015 domain-containing protein [Candidatus Omnitrophica bacterium]|nr:DUF1015 domain-containing protein [Candidatus Omnitrophota bacterium]MDD5430471.1 DUF1015 domain-containing protein [Candidatus Omnitrophota bacterium]